jgi:endonuclease YncB( thermonuclease family)
LHDDPPHRHAEEELMVLARGSGTWSLDEKELSARTGDVLYAAPWTLHGVRNTGDVPLDYYMVKWSSKGVRAPEAPPEDGAGSQAVEEPPVSRKKVRGSTFDPDGWERISGHATVIDGDSMAFADGTIVSLGAADAPELEQKGLLGDALYPCGKESARALEELIGEGKVTCFLDSPRPGAELAGNCFVGDTCLNVEMVQSGWALAHHSLLAPFEVIAREKKRGIWRGEFVVPDRWRKGERLPGE